MEFRRNISVYDDDSDVVAAFLKLNEDILAMPGTDALRLYYEGKPISSIEGGVWHKFRDSYDKYIRKQLDEDSLFWSADENKKEYYFDPEIIAGIKRGISEGLSIDKERKSEQVIALNHQTFESDKYSVCDMETAIPKGDLKGTTRGEGKQAEIDLVAICPEKKSILLIEYKCQQSAVTAGVRESLKKWNVSLVDKNGKKKGEQKNIVAHFKDYLAILEACRNESFVQELIKSYNYLARLREGTEIEVEKGSPELQEYVKNMQILFLFTNEPMKGVPGTRNLTKNLYVNTRGYLKACIELYRKELLDRNKKEEYVNNAVNALCLATVNPENVSLNKGFKNIDGLEFPQN